MKEFEAYEKHLKTVTQQKDLTYVHVVPFLNWVSPSLVMAKAQTLQSQVAGLILNSSVVAEANDDGSVADAKGDAYDADAGKSPAGTGVVI